MNLYQSDVREMSDEELNRLSDELSDEYRVSYTLPCECCTDEEWTDDAAESRHDAMRAEIRRRWDLANPEKAALRRNSVGLLTPGLFAKLALESLAQSVIIARRFNAPDGADPA